MNLLLDEDEGICHDRDKSEFAASSPSALVVVIHVGYTHLHMLCMLEITTVLAHDQNVTLQHHRIYRSQS